MFVTPSETALRPTPWAALPRSLYACGFCKGLGRALMTVAGRFPALRTVPLRVADGRVIVLDLTELQCIPYFLTHDIPNESGETRLIRSLVNPGETTLDIGANLGWFTTLMAERVGTGGRVLAFEPNPKTLRLLRLTARAYPQVEIVPLALLDCQAEGVVLNIPEDGTGASLCELKAHPKVAEERCSTATLDGFLGSRGIGGVAFVKCDVEGVETAVARGGERLLTGERPPIWFAEVNTRERFGTDPSELLGFFEERGFTAYQIDPGTGRLGVIPGAAEGRYNALFVPAWASGKIDAYRRGFDG
jgi:FkbM family methyltransferase